MVILESHRVGSWRALSSRYEVETVEERADLTMGMPENIESHMGEELLSAHAIHRNDTWVFCGPDRPALVSEFKWDFDGVQCLWKTSC